MKARRTLEVWKPFDLVEEEDEHENIIECKYYKICKEQLIAASSGCTTHLKKHLEKCLTRISGGVDPRQSTQNFTPKDNHGTLAYDQQRARELHA